LPERQQIAHIIFVGYLQTPALLYKYGGRHLMYWEEHTRSIYLEWLMLMYYHW
jgi:hypothetical protein